MERAGAPADADNAARGTWVVGSDRQAHERRIPLVSVDPAGQHHDGRARNRVEAVGRAKGGCTGRQRASRNAASAGRTCSKTASSRRQEAGGTKAAAEAANPDFPRSATSWDVERLIGCERAISLRTSCRFI